MNRGRLRPLLAAFVAVAACIAVSPHADAARNSGVLERLVARAVSVADPAGATSAIDIMIERWSTAEEFEMLRGALSHDGPDTLLPALQRTWRRAGVVLTPGIIGSGARARIRRPQNLLFAREISTANGRRVIIAADQHLALGEPPLKERPTEYEFALIDIRFGPDGKGIGKVAPAADVVYNNESKLIEIKNYTAQAVRLTDVRSEQP